MDNNVTSLIISVSAFLISGMMSLLIGLIWWMWRTDREEKAKRIESLETELGHIRSDWMPRTEMQGIAQRIEREFMGRHETIGEQFHQLEVKMRDMNSQLVKELSAQVRTCSNDIMNQVRLAFAIQTGKPVAPTCSVDTP